MAIHSKLINKTRLHAVQREIRGMDELYLQDFNYQVNYGRLLCTVSNLSSTMDIADVF